MDSEPLEDDSKMSLRNVEENHNQLRRVGNSKDLVRSFAIVFFCNLTPCSLIDGPFKVL